MRTKAKTPTPLRDPRFDGGPYDTETLISRFEASRRSRIRKLVASTPRILDLAVTFPGALYAMASAHGTPRQRRRALGLVTAGAALRDVAAELELPLWLRRLPPEAFNGRLEALPKSDIFARRIANHLPSAAENNAFWLNSVLFGVRASDDYFGLWLAQQPVFMDPGDPQRLFGLMAAYAWFSNNDISRSQGLIVVPWRPEMALDTAVCAAKCWLNRIRLVLQLGPGAITNTWLTPGEAQGYSFVPLLDHSEILAEAHAMQNCADQYASRLARDKCRLFSIRRRGARVATLEIGPHPREVGVLAISQLKARHNLPATTEIWQAAHAWLGGQKNLKHPTAVAPPPSRPLNDDAWGRIMAQYRARKNGAPWLPETASSETFADIEHGIGELARRAGITSWLFT